MSRSKLTAPVALALSSSELALSPVAIAQAADNDQFRWDIINADVTATPSKLTAGGDTSATAQDGSGITMTGSGTFRVNPGQPQD